MASAVIAHSHEAARVVCETHGVEPRRVFMIPHGDLSSAHGSALPDRRKARQSLALPDRPLCLMFGRVEPYKGIDEIVDFWNTEQPAAELCIVGHNDGDVYGASLLKRIGGNPSIRTVFRHVADTELASWLAAADCVIFNYRALLTSGAASVARSFGVPLLIPSRLSTVDLGEPNPRVFRFDDVWKLKTVLPEALAIGSDYRSAEPWRRACAWNLAAEKTRDVYEHVLRGT
jgi:glycosyltransferase involved in cell wall biosynthesis